RPSADPRRACRAPSRPEGRGGPAMNQIEQIAEWLRVFIAPDQVTELRALKVCRKGERPHTESGFFDFAHLDKMARAANALSVPKSAKGLYFTLNPLKPDLLAHRANRIGWAEEGELATDKDVLRRTWFFVDADPERDRYVSATDAEKAASLDTILEVRD